MKHPEFITIRTKYGSLLIEALEWLTIYGERCAVHRALNNAGDVRYRVTHVGTGYAMCTVQDTREAAKRRARRNARTVGKASFLELVETKKNEHADQT